MNGSYVNEWIKRHPSLYLVACGICICDYRYALPSESEPIACAALNVLQRCDKLTGLSGACAGKKEEAPRRVKVQASSYLSIDVLVHVIAHSQLCQRTHAARALEVSEVAPSTGKSDLPAIPASLRFS